MKPVFTNVTLVQRNLAMRTRRFLRIVTALSLAGCAFSAVAQAFPSKPVTIVVPFPAGGALDTVARAIAEPMRMDLGQAVIVDNRPGAGGTVGSAQVARAAPDGHMLFDLKTDPDERRNLAGSSEHAAVEARLRGEILKRWQYAALEQQVLESQQRRLFAQQALLQGRWTAWDYQPPEDAARKYVRGAVDPNTTATKARKRFPFVAEVPAHHPRDPLADRGVAPERGGGSSRCSTSRAATRWSRAVRRASARRWPERSVGPARRCCWCRGARPSLRRR